MAFITGEKSLSKKNILRQLDSYQLFKAYCSKFVALDVMFSSEFRPDPVPSCHIIMWEGDLLYKDFGEKGSYRIFDYIARKFQTDFKGALGIVNKDFKLGLQYSTQNNSEPTLLRPEKSLLDYPKLEKKPTVIDIRPRPWTKLDKEYWSSYSIPLRLLEYHNIKSISHYRISNNTVDNAMYALNPYMVGYSMDYYWNKGVFRRKLYFPQMKDRRFVSNVDATIVQGWTLLPKKGKVLFVTKSYKDILIFNLLGYWAIAPNSENTYMPDEVMIKLKLRFDNIFVWFDNDLSGIEGSAQFNKKFELKGAIHNPLGEPKDPSDYVKKYNLSEFDKLLNNFLNGTYR
jgi:hypothetical protein